MTNKITFAPKIRMFCNTDRARLVFLSHLSSFILVFVISHFTFIIICAHNLEHTRRTLTPKIIRIKNKKGIRSLLGGKQQLFIEIILKRISTRSIALL